MFTQQTGRIVSLLGFAVLALAGCKSTYQEAPLGNRVRPKLRTDATAYVAIPPDAWFKKDMAFDSGKMTALAVRDEFAKYLKRAYLGRRVETLQESLQIARQHHCTYLVYPSVLRWEDRTTEYTGRRDKIEIQIKVVEPESGQTLHAVILKGRSRWMSDGGDVPQDLLETPIKKYVASLFQTLEVPAALR